MRDPEAPPVSLGRQTGEPIALEDGNIELVYHHGMECKADKHYWITRFVFSCETQVEVSGGSVVLNMLVVGV